MTSTVSGLIVPELTTASSVRRFTSTMAERGSREAVSQDTCATFCATEWDALPGVSNSRYGRNGGSRAARHLRYMAKLERQLAKAADELYADYVALVHTPWRMATGQQGRFDPSK